jgi:hypothetical protein
MSIRIRRVLLALLAFLSLFPSAAVSFVTAQEAGQVRPAPAETASFPRITTYLDVRNAEGSFIYGLEAENIRVLEDNQPLPVAEMNLLRPGAQVVVAINPGPAFAIRDSQGLTRYDYLVQSLHAWTGARQGSTIDELSLLATGGTEATHLPDIEAWLSALAAYQPDARTAVSNFDVLARALEIAADPTPRPGMGRVILLITSIPEQDLSVGVESLAARASQLGLRVFVWLVASAEQFSSQGAVQLADLAAQTGGALFAYSGVEPIPSLEEYLEPLRSTYFLAYDSRITTSGTHQLAVQIQSQDLDLTSLPHEFELEVLPPNVAFVSPPLEIERTAPVEAPEDLARLEPNAASLEVLVEFPDGHPRALKRVTLYVDGAIADENTASPFEQFTWDLSEYTATSQHILKAEVVDSLGMNGNSVELPVLVSFERPPQTVLVTISRNRTVVAGLTVGLAGSILLLVLVLGGRIRPGALRGFRRGRRRSTDPVTQPVRMKTEPGPQRMPAWMDRLHWPQRRLPPKAFAFMVRLSESDQTDGSAPILITSDEITFGRDPLQAIHLLEDPSVEALHARLRRGADGSFRLFDEGSTAGTWINYTPVSQEGARLEHGDLIHLGRIGFRFSLREPERVRKPVIIPKGPDLDPR